MWTCTCCSCSRAHILAQSFPFPILLHPPLYRLFLTSPKIHTKKLHPGTQTKTLTLLCLIMCLLLPGYTWIIVLPNDIRTSCSFTHHVPWHHSVCLSHSSSCYLLFWGVFCKSVCCCCCCCFNSLTVFLLET